MMSDEDKEAMKEMVTAVATNAVELPEGDAREEYLPATGNKRRNGTGVKPGFHLTGRPSTQRHLNLWCVK